MLSIVFPAYNEEGNVGELHRRIVAACTGCGEPFEIIAVDDCSTDRTLTELKKLSPVTVVSLSRNMGQSAALDAGIKHAVGDIIITIDADLQNDPGDIPLLLKKLDEGYDVVSGWRVERNDTLVRRAISGAANQLTARVTGLKLHDSAGPLKAMRRHVLEGVHLYGEMHSFLPAILLARGARVTEIPVRHSPRVSGKPKYYAGKLAKSTADLFVVKFFSSYMARPLLFFGGWGIFSIVLGFVSGGASIVLKLMEIRNITQTPLPILAVLFIVVGFLLIMIGFLAEILLRIYYETQGAMPYVVREVTKH